MNRCIPAVGLAGLLACGVLAAPADAITQGDTKITKVVINKGHNFAVGANTVKKFGIVVAATDDSGIATLTAVPQVLSTGVRALTQVGAPYCEDTSATRRACTFTYSVDTRPSAGQVDDTMAGLWTVEVSAVARDGDFALNGDAGRFRVKRAARLTINATPEPAKKGSTIKVAGKLTRASWTKGAYIGYTGRTVRLQYKKAGTTTFTTVRTVTSTSGGAVTANVKATATGTFRWVFGGTADTWQVTSGVDGVVVR